MAKLKATNSASNSNFEKADAFINLSLIASNGKTVQLGGIPLRKSTQMGLMLITAVEEGRLTPELLSEKLVVTSINIVGSEAEELDFGF